MTIKTSKGLLLTTAGGHETVEELPDVTEADDSLLYIIEGDETVWRVGEEDSDILITAATEAMDAVGLL